MPPVTLECPANLEVFKEREWQNAVVHAAAFYGWFCNHVRAMQYNDPGLPDLVCLRGSDDYEEGAQVRLIELKTMSTRSKLRASQERWIERAKAFGVDVHVLRPCPQDWERLLELLR